MATKTDRILSYLPGTFKALPRPTVLYTLVNAFGTELLHGENSLAAVMQSHWIDHADRFTESIDDLARIGALYGLTPRPDESVEEFREHLKRYIRIFLEGTVTVQGILRITAQALGIQIADDYADMDTWWKRKTTRLIRSEYRADDASEMLFGTREKVLFGNPPQPASILGRIDLSAGMDLTRAPNLKIKVDKFTPLTIDLTDGIANPATIQPDEIITVINSASIALFEKAIAQTKNKRLLLTSPSTGVESRLEIQSVDADAAPALLGILPRIFKGSTELPATLTGLHNLENGTDLRHQRYLRLIIDNTHLAEIDCAGPSPENSSLDQIAAAINSAFGFQLASHDGRFLTLISPSSGFSSSIGLLQTAAQDAKNRLFGAVNTVHTGTDALPARVKSTVDLSQGIDLSGVFNVRVIMDQLNAVTINCAGTDPENTQLPEIVSAINKTLGRNEAVASQNGRFITLQSPQAGSDSYLEFRVPNNDATEKIFGVGLRKFAGKAPDAARFGGHKIQLNENGQIDISARRFLKLAIDGRAARIINLSQQLIKQQHDPRKADLDMLADAINQGTEQTVAASVNGQLLLTSPTTGAASQLALGPLLEISARRFVTRAVISEEASRTIFGFVEKHATGSAAKPARLLGTRDLSHGVDLRDAAFISLALDNQEPIDIHCAGKRPRATLLSEIVANINQRLPGEVASHDGKHLLITSQLAGENSRIRLATPRSSDALDTLLGIAPTSARGSADSGVNFVGTANLAQNIDLSTASHIQLVLDGEAVEIDCAGAAPEQTRGREIVNQINLELINRNLKPVASFDGTHILLKSTSTGSQSSLAFETPSTGADASPMIFGIQPPRTYRGQDALSAQITGLSALDSPVNLGQARFLNLSINGGTAIIVDCAAQANDATAVSLEAIINAINERFDDPVASTQDGSHLLLSSPTSGSNSQIKVAAHHTSDARHLLFGDSVAEDTQGSPFQAAVIAGQVDLLAPVDLSDRRIIRLAVNHSAPVDIDVGGVAPATTFLDEIIRSINTVFPGLADSTEQDKLQLTAPITESGSQLALLPLRHLELIEYPPTPKTVPVNRIQHGSAWRINNAGIAEARSSIHLTSAHGSYGSQIVNLSHGLTLKLWVALAPKDALQIGIDSEGKIIAMLESHDGTSSLLAAEQYRIGPVCQQVLLPSEHVWFLRRANDGKRQLLLNNPLAKKQVVLRDKTAAENAISVTVQESKLSELHNTQDASGHFVGRVNQWNGTFRLLDINDTKILELNTNGEIDLSCYLNHVVKVTGVYSAEPTALLMVNEINRLFDLTVCSPAEEGGVIQELFSQVTIGDGDQRNDSLVRVVTLQSRLVNAKEITVAAWFNLPRGKSNWLYMECSSSRFDAAFFNENRFSGGHCQEQSVFNISRFANAPPEDSVAVFSGPESGKQNAVDLRYSWLAHQAGAFTVNLPDDLPKRFGGRFNQSRFSHGNESTEHYPNAVTEPEDDAMFLVKLLENGNPTAGLPASTLVKARVVNFVPLGWAAVTMPFRKPNFLTLGAPGSAAKIYLAEPGLNGFIEISAREPGDWGNEIAVSSRLCGPALYEFAVYFESARFENARQTVLGRPLAVLTNAALKPGPVGVLQAKATGIKATVSRDRTGKTLCNYTTGE